LHLREVGNDGRLDLDDLEDAGGDTLSDHIGGFQDNLIKEILHY
jgi:hypothetical protein